MKAEADAVEIQWEDPRPLAEILFSRVTVARTVEVVDFRGDGYLCRRKFNGD